MSQRQSTCIRVSAVAGAGPKISGLRIYFRWVDLNYISNSRVLLTLWIIVFMFRQLTERCNIMPNKAVFKKIGFTLIELSIVMVIIGLLVGGILAARSMVSTTKITRTISDLAQYDIAVSNFKSLYNALPGDSNAFDIRGNQDGTIAYTDETSHFWSDLSLGVELKNNKGVNYSTISNCGGWSTAIPYQNCPVLSLERYSTSASATAPCLSGSSADLSGNAVIAPSFFYGPYTSCGASTGVVYPRDALALDQKLDNANASSGSILSVGTSCASSGTYNLTANGSCSMRFDIGIQSNNQ